MSVACDCSTDSDWYYEGPSDFSILDTKRGRRCFSCNELVKVGAEVGKFWRHRPSNDEYELEDRIYGDEVPLATWYACETCAGLYFSIIEAGYCVMIGDGMTMAENARLTSKPELWDYE